MYGPESKVSCHYLVDEDGTITQMVGEELRAWHAGVSSWQGETDTNSRSIGIEIVKKALTAPARQIIDNAGDDAAVIVGKLVEAKGYTDGYNAQAGEFVDMVKAGIIDPTKVVRTAIQDAASVAGLLITTEAMIAEAPKRESAPAMPGGGGMGGMGGMDF